MAKKFVLYVNDSVIKVYHTHKNTISFYNQYNIEILDSVNGLLSLLKKYYKWHIYLFLETSEVMIDKKIFDKKNFKEIKPILYQYTHKPDLLISCSVQNDQKGKSKITTRTKEYGVLSIMNSTYLNLKNLLNTISDNKSKIKIINFVPICLGISKIVKNEQNTINIVAKLRKDNTYTIDVFYGHSFIIHRDDTLDNKTNISQEIISTISYVETIITSPNITFVTTIFTEIQISRDETSNIKSDTINIINGKDILYRFDSKIKLGKHSNSEIDDSLLSVIYSNKCYHTNFINSKLNKKNLFFKILPASYVCVALFFLGILASELNNIFVVMPKNLEQIEKAEKELNGLQAKLDKLKKIAIDSENLSYIESCAKLEDVDVKKADYIDLVKKFSTLADKYIDSVVITDYDFICNKNCYSKDTASYKLSVNGIIFNRFIDYENMTALSNTFFNDIKTEFKNFKVLLPDSKITPKIGATYNSLPFKIIISSQNAS